ncbi:MAG: 1-acyl-sn-glycerol-3-phosphate acyltransferase [Oscillospiraceae bacterium]|nr:1-acyl-sn-glycerol-3-phosphate acyltransferase [Oscillospiraceae bacterium]
MKIKTKTATYEEVMSLPPFQHQKPQKPDIFFRTLVRLLSEGDLKAVNFKYTSDDISSLKDQPCFILMNHSSFIDLEIASKMLYPRPYSIICTSDGFVGKDWLLRKIGCIPTEKFVSDVILLKDILYAVKKLNNSILMYPEASYSFDGTATDLPSGLGKFIKKLGIPVLFIKTEGAFARDPLYNMLQKRKVDVSAHLRYLLSPEQIKDKTGEEIDAVLKEAFTFDNFRWQKENHVVIDEPFRADGLERILYKCPCCGAEGHTKGKGIRLECSGCGAQWVMNELGEVIRQNGENRFTHIPDWYSWERECVRQEIIEGTYKLNVPVSIGLMVNHEAIYMVGDGKLIHDNNGFHLSADDGSFNYEQAPQASYSCYSDYYWYELGDIICIGEKKCLYYCFPKVEGVVAKTRLATEELYKLVNKR